MEDARPSIKKGPLVSHDATRGLRRRVFLGVMVVSTARALNIACGSMEPSYAASLVRPSRSQAF